MSAGPEQARTIAERIAKRVSSESGISRDQSLNPASPSDVSSELAAMRAGLSELQRRLAQIEAKVRAGSEIANPGPFYGTHAESSQKTSVPLTHSPWLAGVNASMSHPSQERFGVEEATVTELVDFFEKEKTCSIEPGGKPCDHCAMCSSRGF